MTKKYWVPALERADAVLQAIAAQPSGLKLIDLSRMLDIHKSSMFSLLHTMETLQWVVRDKGDTYSLGAALGAVGSAFLQQNGLVTRFHKEAAASIARVGETIQMAQLERAAILYLAKEEAVSPVQLVSSPGMKLPAYVTSLGKMLLALLPREQFRELYPQLELEPMTPYTVTDRSKLEEQLDQFAKDGYAFDLQESVVGFCCVGAPIYDAHGHPAAAVSFSVPIHHWADKKEAAIDEIVRLAARLSLRLDNRTT